MIKHLLTVLCVLIAHSAMSEPKLLWGDTHLHTSLSFDAFLNGNDSATPDVAYRFAKGEPVIHPMHRARMQLDEPLDFLVIADHAELYGVGREVYHNGVYLPDDAGLVDKVKAWATQWYVRRLINGDAGFDAFLDLLPETGDPRSSAETMWGDNGDRIMNSAPLETKTWQYAIKLADQYNEPGVFTTFIGWEWSSLPGGANLHRVVMTSAGADVATQFEPFGSDDSPYPEDLWAWLDKTSAATGAEFLSIPHNSNISKGFMFDVNSLRGEPFTEQYAQQRLRLEPIAEITQIKGDSETLGLFSPEDEFANFETYGWYIQQTYQKYNPKPGDYIRPALKRGLELEKTLGINPYQFGLIGSTDAHTGLATADEDNFAGKLARDSTPESKSRPDSRTDFASGWSMSASGLAAVWAEDNTREAIMAALKRREVYATSGPRIALQFYGAETFAITADNLESAESAATARAQGVPMGSELRRDQFINADAAPTFALFAMRATHGANLDRAQIVKGWLDANGKTHERVYNVAWSDERIIDDSGKLPALASTVDRKTGRHTDSTGSTKLSALWQDPDFDPEQSAFYYVRVLQIPTARHLLMDAIALGLEKPLEGDAVIQERAYSSPIWYKP